MASLVTLRHIARVIATDQKGTPLFGHSEEGVLTLDGIEWFEAEMRVRARNTRQVRTEYAN